MKLRIQSFIIISACRSRKITVIGASHPRIWWHTWYHLWCHLLPIATEGSFLSQEPLQRSLRFFSQKMAKLSEQLLHWKGTPILHHWQWQWTCLPCKDPIPKFLKLFRSIMLTWLCYHTHSACHFISEWSRHC